MQLQPTEQFTISRQLGPTDDTDTHYVRAVVRNALTDKVLATVKLSDKGNRRFTSVYEVPADVSGQGFYITITTTVFVDSAFTTYDPNYEEVAETYLVQVRANGIGNGGGGSDMDYDLLKEMIKEAVSEMETSAGDTDFSPVLALLAEIDKRVAAIPTKHPEVNITTTQVDIKPVLEAMLALGKQIDSLPKEVPETDLTPLHDSFGDLSRLIGESVGGVRSDTKNMASRLEEVGSTVQSLVPPPTPVPVIVRPTPVELRNRLSGGIKKSPYFSK